tara:strand:- start:12352 stop:13035 length:684 start_codon:yes stop_codon:yes gene_type:complete
MARAILNAGKVVEITAVNMIEEAGGAAAGSRDGWRKFSDYACYHGFMIDPTDEKSARQRKTELYTPNGSRINPGRGERIFDAVVKAPIVGMENSIHEFIPASIKAGDSRDISVDIPALRGWIESGAPLWVYCIDGDADPIHYREGVVPFATNLVMRRINLTDIVKAQSSDPWTVDGPKRWAFLRNMKVNGYTYKRFRVNWKSVPNELWLDKDWVPFNPSAPLPLPWR